MVCMMVLWLTWCSYNIKYDALNKELYKTQESLQMEVSKTSELNQIIDDLKDSEYELVYMGEFKTTYYCNEARKHICGEGANITASGKPTIVGDTVAVDKSLIPLGSKVYISGIGWRSAEDTGGAIIGNRVDVLVNGHDEAIDTGVTYNDVWVLVKKS